MNSAVKEHPTVAAHRRRLAPETLSEPLAVAWLRQLCLDAGADDVGFVEVARPALRLKTDANPGGLPIEVFDGIRAGSIANRSQLYRDIASGPFFGFNPGGPHDITDTHKDRLNTDLLNFIKS